jgi:hypothetical protein
MHILVKIYTCEEEKNKIDLPELSLELTSTNST